MENKTEITIDTAADYVGAALGATAGAGIGLAIAGPAGAAIGSLAGTAIEKAVLWAGKEIKERCLSKSENKKIGTVYDTAKRKINYNIDSGKTLRQDDFFESNETDKSSSEEILEGTLFAAQRENEEKKLPYLANMYANINFDETVSRPMANQLLKIASEITYRQMVILSVIGKVNYHILDLPLREHAFRGFNNYHDMSIAAEIFDLYRMSLLISKEAILDAASFTPSLLVMNGMGEILFNLMELSNIPNDGMTNSIIMFLTDSLSPNDDGNTITAQLPIRQEVETIISEQTMSKEEINEVIKKETAKIPHFEFTTEENGVGGQTLKIDRINGGNATEFDDYVQGKVEKYIDERIATNEEVEEMLKKL